MASMTIRRPVALQVIVTEEFKKELAEELREAIDATKKHEYPALALPPKEHLLRVDEKWAAYGLD